MYSYFNYIYQVKKGWHRSQLQIVLESYLVWLDVLYHVKEEHIYISSLPVN